MTFYIKVANISTLLFWYVKGKQRFSTFLPPVIKKDTI